MRPHRDHELGPDRAVDVHRACAEERRVPVLFEHLGTIRAEHVG
ncbi:hypothetical protein [Streptomyces sp. ISL-10]|nr:hypothetical protein [Streptomyces sp. ISL-10]